MISLTDVVRQVYHVTIANYQEVVLSTPQEEAPEQNLLFFLEDFFYFFINRTWSPIAPILIAVSEVSMDFDFFNPLRKRLPLSDDLRMLLKMSESLVLDDDKLEEPLSRLGLCPVVL